MSHEREGPKTLKEFETYVQGSQPTGGGPTLDSATTSFLTATGITDPTMTTAIDTAVLALKSQNLWDKLLFAYPIVGGNANAHKFNLKDARDLDAAFRITWFGGLTHNANGVTGNGVDGYGDTHFNFAAFPTTDNNCHVSAYIRNSINNAAAQTMSMNDGLAANVNLAAMNGSGNTVCSLGVTTGTVAGGVPGMYILNRTNSANFDVMRKGVSSLGLGGVSYPLSPAPLYLMARDNAVSGVPNGTPTLFDVKNNAWFSAGYGMTLADETNFTNIVQAFQTALGRNV